MFGAHYASVGRFLVAGGMLLASAVADLAVAVEAPVWKFKPEQVSRYRIAQTMEMGMDTGAGGKTARRNGRLA